MKGSWITLASATCTQSLVRQIEAAGLAIGRLDSRVSASFVGRVWQERTLFTGAAATLAGRGQHFTENELFTVGGVALPASSPPACDSPGAQLLERWRPTLSCQNTLHWRELITSSVDLPEDWLSQPGLLKALALAAHHAQRSELNAAPVLPHLLQAFCVSRALLPNLALADPAWRYAPRDLIASARRMLRQLASSADEGLARLHRLERDYARAAQVLAKQTRAGGLPEVLALAERAGAVTPRGVARDCGLTLSGAGKQLVRAADLGLLVEVTGRTSWRTYLVPDLARQFGFLSVRKGRPPSPTLPPMPLDATLAAFDAEMASIDALLARNSAAGFDAD